MAGLALALAPLLTACVAPGPFAPAEGPLFGLAEVENHTPHLFAKWREMLGRHAGAPPGVLAAVLQGTALASTADHQPGDLLDRVNRTVNRLPYRSDDLVYGLADYWAAPAEFFAAGGDCEDFAIAKLFALEALGFAAEDLRIVIGHDRRGGDIHAVLAVAVPGDIMILDNKTAAILSHSRIDYFEPIYSINRGRWWLHQRDEGSRQNAASAP